MAGKKGRKSSGSYKSYYGAYKSSNTEGSNRIKKLNRHLKKHPNDTQAQKALTQKPVHRKKPAGSNKTIKKYGIQSGEGYVSENVYKNGHPVLQMLKSFSHFDNYKKLRNCAIFSEEFKVVYSNYVS